MRVTLVRSPFYSLFGYGRFGESLALLYLAAALEREDHEPSIVDGEILGMEHSPRLGLTYRIKNFLTPILMKPGQAQEKYNEVMKDENHHLWGDIASAIFKTHPDLIGLTTYTPGITGVQHICHKIKEESEVPIYLGGIHASALPRLTLKETGADGVIVGEGEREITNLVSRIEKGLSTPRIIHSNSFIEELDSIPYPARHLLKDYNDFYSTQVITSRGCPYNCIFCASHIIWGHKPRFRSPENVVGELIELKEKHGVDKVRICDDTFTLSKRHVLGICEEIIQSRVKIGFSCGSRVDTLDSEMAEALKRAGCYRVTLGIESGNQQVLYDIKKNIKKEDAERTVKILKEAGLEAYTYFMIGHPTDTKQTIQDTRDFMKKLDPDMAEASIVTPFPGTELWEFFSKHNTDNIDWFNFFCQSEGVISSGKLSKEEISKEFKTTYKDFSRHILKKRIFTAKGLKKYSIRLIQRNLRKLSPIIGGKKSGSSITN